jgi:septal ring factor EnvC (AmiA/AmiB activator)
VSGRFSAPGIKSNFTDKEIKMKSLRIAMFSLLIVGGAFMMAGCSSNPSADDLSHLDALKQEVTSLQKEVADKKTEKATLEQQVSTKKQELAQAVQDENETKANLANYK